MQPQPKPSLATEILVVDDDAELGQLIADYLRQNGFVVHVAADAAAMDRILANAPISLVLLDIVLPGESGLSICRRLVHEGGPPVMMMTGVGSDVDRIIALELGADDCLSKPSNPREMLARVRAVLRRTAAPVAAPPPAQGTRYEFMGFALDVVRRHLRSPAGITVLLPPSELSLLTVFLQHPGEVLSRERLVELVRREEGEILERAIDTHVSRLRRKLAAHTQGELISTVYGTGYRCNVQVLQG